MITTHTTDAYLGGYRKRASLSSIIIGLIIALGFTIMLSLLGTGIGFSAIDPLHDAKPMAGIATGAGIFMLITQLIALGIGGYVAGRLTSGVSKCNAMLHGAAVWALATIVMLYAAVGGAGALMSGTGNVISSIVSGTGKAVEAAVPDDFDITEIDLTDIDVPDEVVAQLPREMQRAIRNQNATLGNIRDEFADASRQVISRGEQEQIEDAASETAANIARNPGNAGEEIDALVDQLFGAGKPLSGQDREQAIAVVAEKLGVSKQEAEVTLQRWEQEIQQVTAEMKRATEEMKQEALRKAEQATDALSKAAWAAFIASLLGLIAAVVGAGFGRPLEDDVIVQDRIVRN